MGRGFLALAPALRVVLCSNRIPLEARVDPAHRSTAAHHHSGGRYITEADRNRRGWRALSATLPPHVQCQWKGAVLNREVLKHYRTQPVDSVLTPEQH
ncbi:MAG: hypothetical protein IPN85_13345 [Flavobacteriales bacterium]|nr:hypothetical protein [Flavobacteriales bacterium]